MAGDTAGMVIGMIMAVIVVAVLVTNLSSAISLTGAGNTTFNLIVTLAWVAFTILAVGIIAVVGKWIINIFS
jgi:hypothetical protein